MKLKKELSFFDVFSLAAGAMISSGIFILPGLAFSQAGPAVFVAYFLAGILALAGVLNVAELATAMPKAGGDYYFITRSLGPFVGTISGMLSWFAISLKSAFAIFGLAEVLYLLTGINITVLAVIFCLLFVVINIVGVKEAAIFELVLVAGLLALMGLYIVLGITRVDILQSEPFAPQGINAVLSTAGFVFVSFGGLLTVASVAEEVKNPARNVPLGLLAAVIVVTMLYTLLLIVTIGVLPADTLRNSLTPVADAAKQFTGQAGYIVITIAAMLAFITTANAGMMSASRYPLALSEDKLLPTWISRMHPRFQTPIAAVIITGGLIIASLFLPLEILVKAASTVVLTANVLANLAVIILRESRLQNYQPTFKSPLYPWVQGGGIVLFVFLIVDMGYETIEISAGLVIAGILLYLFYGRKRVQQEYALLHLIERITSRQLTSHDLEAELRDILHQRDEVIHDPFDRLVASAPVIDVQHCLEREAMFAEIAERLTEEISLAPPLIIELLQAREREGSTAITPFTAVPHLVIDGQHRFKILIARCRQGVRFSDDAPAVKAIFVIVGTRDERLSHLKALAAIAQIIQHRDFEDRWQNAKTDHQLRDILLLSERKRTV
jgi:amino acid transporter/mannitol/fructose-specific phosphotransferase system IIA component (Ntr-type)